MSSVRATLILVTVVCFCLIAAPAVGNSEYDISTDASIDVPDRTIEQGGDTFTITAVSQVDPGESISVTADAPGGTDITVYLYDRDQRIVTAREGTGTSTFEFSITADDVAGDVVSGTYAFVLQHDGTRQAAHPLVVRGYSVDASAPDTATRGETISVSAEIEKLRGQDMESVEVVMASDATTVRKPATASGGGTYTAEIDTSDLSAGSYDVYANVRGPDSALGEKELLGIATPTETRVEADETEETESGGGGGGGGGGAAPADPSTPTGTATDHTTPSGQATPGDGSAATERFTTELVDGAPEEAGVTVHVGGTNLRDVTFADEAVRATGNLTVERSASPPETVATEVGEHNVLAWVDIRVPPAARDAPATLRFTLSSSEVGDRAPESMGVARVTDGGIQLLPVDVTTTADGGLTIEAETPGFSEFAVVSVPSQTTTGQTTATSAETTATDGAITPGDGTNPTEGSGETHAFRILILLTVGAVLAVHLARRT